MYVHIVSTGNAISLFLFFFLSEALISSILFSLHASPLHMPKLLSRHKYLPKIIILVQKNNQTKKKKQNQSNKQKSLF